MPKEPKMGAVARNEIQKNPFLGLDLSEKVVKKYVSLTTDFGKVTPVVVGVSENGKTVICGEAALKAYEQCGADTVPALLVELAPKEQLELTAALMLLRDASTPLALSACVNELINRHGVSQRELCGSLGKSKAWLSKIESLVTRLSAPVKEMVAEGTVSTEAAAAISRLPIEVQAEFAANAARDELPKSDVAALVSRYLDEKPKSRLRLEILKKPGGLTKKFTTRRHTIFLARSLDGVLVLVDSLRDRLIQAKEEELRQVADRLPGAVESADNFLKLLLNIQGLVLPAKQENVK